MTITVIVLSVFFSLLMLLVNHVIWYRPQFGASYGLLVYRALKLFVMLAIILGSFVSVYNMLVFILSTKDSYPLAREKSDGTKDYLSFVIPFAVFMTVYCLIYFLCYYPGILSIDSIDQITQMFTGVYSNHHPLSHTLLVQLFLKAGLAVSSDMNRAVSVYVIFQMILMSATFAFTVSTMKKMRIHRALVIASAVFFAVMPFHIMFSFTIWKDVIFGAAVTLFVVSATRIMKNIGNAAVNYTVAAVSSVMFCLTRSNGLFAFVIVAAAVFLLMRKHMKLFVIMVSAIVISLVIKHGVFSMFDVAPPDTVEMLSIPLQQVARVNSEGGYMSDEDISLLSEIIDVEAAKTAYDPGLSDPIKNMIRDFGNQQFITQNRGRFISLYLRTFIHNPVLYFIAWADQTKGFWNSGYPCMVWFGGIENNSLGIRPAIASPAMRAVFEGYLRLFYENPVFQVFVSIGLFVWAMLLMLYRSLAGGNKSGIIATMPIAAIVLSLVISTPAFSEFRYVYALFCLLPFIAAAALTEEEDITADKEHSSYEEGK